MGRSTTPTALAASSLFALVLLSLQGCVYLGVDMPEVRASVQASSLEFEQVDGMPADMVVSATRRFDLDITEELDSEFLRDVSWAQIKEFKLVPHSGVSDLDFVRDIVVRLEGPGDLPTVVIAEKLMEPSGRQDGSIMMALSQHVDHTEYLTQAAGFSIDLTYANPATAWSLAVDLVLALEIDHWEQVM